MNTISILAGLGAMLLVIELLVVVILAGAAVFFARRGLAAGRREAAPYVQLATQQIQRVEVLTKDYSALIISPQVGVISLVRGLRRGVGAMFHEADSGDGNVATGEGN